MPNLNIGLANDVQAYRDNLGGLATDIHNRMQDAKSARDQMAITPATFFTAAAPGGLGMTADEEYAQRVATEQMGALADWYLANAEAQTRPLRGVIGS